MCWVDRVHGCEFMNGPGRLVVAGQMPEDAVRSCLAGLDGVEYRQIGADLSGLEPDVECLVLLPESFGGTFVAPPSWPGAVQWIQLASSGVDGYPDWLLRNMTVATMHGANAVAVAELAMATILAAAKRIPEIWAESVDWPRKGLGDVAGATLGLVGFGAIGAAVADRAAAFGMDIQATRATDKPFPGAVRRAASLETLFATSDHVVLALPSSAATRQLVDAALLEQAKPGLHLVNVARGDLIDEVALIAALDAKVVSLASLDVLAVEPPPADHPLLHHPRARVSAHVGGNTPQAIGGSMRRLRRNIESFRAGRPLEGLIDTAMPAGQGSR